MYTDPGALVPPSRTACQLGLLCAALALMLLPACGGEPEPELPPEVAGSYTLALQQSDSGCYPPEYDFWEIFAFAQNNGNNLPIITAEIEQIDSDLEASLGPSGCVLAGAVVVGGAFSLTGNCDDSLMARGFTMTGTITPFGANLELEATLVIDVELLVNGAPDGEADCVVTAVDVSGTGAPAQ